MQAVDSQTSGAADLDASGAEVEHAALRGAGPLRAHLLARGELSLLISAAGAGVTTCCGLDVNRFREDASLEAGGIYFYIRDVGAGRVWSAAYQPTRAEPDTYRVTFAPERVVFQRRDGDVQTLTEVALSTEDAVEVRRLTLTNAGAAPRELEVTAYTEVVLAPRGADVGHRAFSSMFLETAALPERGALLARRRPRHAHEVEGWLLQVLTGDGAARGAFDYDTSRATFIGRNRTTEAPLGLATRDALAQRTGRVLDPVLVLRRRVRLEPGGSARLALVTGLVPSRDAALALLERYAPERGASRVLEPGWGGAPLDLGRLGIDARQLHRYQRLLSALVFPNPALREPAVPTGAGGVEALWAHGISGDVPVLLCVLDDAAGVELAKELLAARGLWRAGGFASDLVVIAEGSSAAVQAELAAVRELAPAAELGRRGGVFLFGGGAGLGVGVREVLGAVARVLLRSSAGPLEEQLRRAASERVLPPPFEPRRAAPQLSTEAAAPRPPLSYDNGVGGFAADGRYEMRLGEGVHTPAPWCNVIANPHFGTLVTESGAAYTWSINSQRHRLTPWSNDTVTDPSGELIFVRDDEDGSFWSATPEPAGRGAPFTVSHAPGQSRFEQRRHGLRQELLVFVSARDPIKVARLRIENTSGRARLISVYGYVEWVLGAHRENGRVAVGTSWDGSSSAVLASSPLALFPTHTAFFAATSRPSGYTADRAEFFGLGGSRRAPLALARTSLSGKVGAGLDPCAALHVELRLAPGETAELSFLLGEADSAEAARAVLRRHADAALVAAALEASEESWSVLLGAVRVETPDRSVDLLVNHWLLYQAVSSRLWGRTGFYQSSGAYGFRDQLQDVLATIHSRPELAREHLLRAAARQFVEGDVQHWWHPETGHGMRTRCSDDMLWLPYVAAHYVRMTGDGAVLDELVPFLRERSLREDEEELYSAPPASDPAPLYEHCVRALRAGATRGAHGLPTMRACDWNDGMNRVGAEGRGESVWLAWFLARTLQDFSVLAQDRADQGCVRWCAEEVERLRSAIEAHAWDGEWYRRATFDDGTPLGSRSSAECKIDAIAQSWAVIAGIGDPARAARAVRASEQHLVSEELALMKLLDPPFEHTVPNPGYIQAYPPGIRENGGQYTHGVLWTLQALTLLGEAERAGALLGKLNPITHGATREIVERYRVEPYVVAADVYSSAEHGGRGGWTWYTGSAGWMYRIIVENVLGVQRRGRELLLAPCVPSGWRSFSVRYRYGAATYELRFENPLGKASKVSRLEVDGVLASGSSVPLVDDGRVHQVRVTLGELSA